LSPTPTSTGSAPGTTTSTPTSTSTGGRPRRHGAARHRIADAPLDGSPLGTASSPAPTGPGREAATTPRKTADRPRVRCARQTPSLREEQERPGETGQQPKESALRPGAIGRIRRRTASESPELPCGHCGRDASCRAWSCSHRSSDQSTSILPGKTVNRYARSSRPRSSVQHSHGCQTRNPLSGYLACPCPRPPVPHRPHP